MQNNEEHNINYEYIIRYLRDTIPQSTGHIAEMEAFAKSNEVPISQPESIRFVEVLLKIKGAKKILELGTAIGYSACWGIMGSDSMSFRICRSRCVTVSPPKLKLFC